MNHSKGIKKCGIRALGIAGAILLFTSSSGHSQLWVSLFAGPSTSYQQDLKYKVYDAQGNIISKNTVSSDTFLRGVLGAKISYFFHKNIGIEAEYSYGRTLAGIETTNDGQIDTRLNQDRHSFMFSFVLQQATRMNKVSAYGGAGAGAFYSSFEGVGEGLDYGGKLFSGVNYSMSEKYTLFSELNLSWAPDVLDESKSPGTRHYKTSGHSSWTSHIFGPHNDEQIYSFKLGLRFRII